MWCASVTVAYNPDPLILLKQLDALPEDWIKILVDNGSRDQSWGNTFRIFNSRTDIHIISMKRNVGLAAAQNTGLNWLAENSKCTHVLLLDQDSEPFPDAAVRLRETYSQLDSKVSPVGAVGPALIDPLSGARHQFHVSDGWRWHRTDGTSGMPLRCSGLNGSGTFMSLPLARSLGGMDESLFIDLVDAEWSFRLIAHGYALYGVPLAKFNHRMGEATKRIWLFGWRAWPIRAPIRHRYLFRNYILLIKRPYVPKVWKIWATMKMGLLLIVFISTGPNRFSQLMSMSRGICDGLRGRSGALQ